MCSSLFQAPVTVGSHAQKTEGWNGGQETDGRSMGDRGSHCWVEPFGNTNAPSEPSSPREEGWLPQLPPPLSLLLWVLSLSRSHLEAIGQESADCVLWRWNLELRTDLARKKTWKIKWLTTSPLLVPSGVCCRKTLDVSNEGIDCCSLLLLP